MATRYLTADLKFCLKDERGMTLFLDNMKENQWEVLYDGEFEMHLRLKLSSNMNDILYKEHMLWAVGKYLGSGKSCRFEIKQSGRRTAGPVYK
jgi:hypothetical protein